ncbi:MAG: PIN domain-containing protein [Betaproteobacteria bacterium]|nr:PIN domain-containing protein [Betaproteobacteria bacterium]
MANVLVDTGFLVALGRKSDPLHVAARAFFLREIGPLITVSPVIVETCFFLDAEAKIEFLDLAQSPRLRTLELPVDAYSEVGSSIRKYADRDIDFADAALIWLANRTGIRHILTTDKTDFGVYRLKGGKRFELIKWFER